MGYTNDPVLVIGVAAAAIGLLIVTSLLTTGGTMSGGSGTKSRSRRIRSKGYSKKNR